MVEEFASHFSHYTLAEISAQAALEKIPDAVEQVSHKHYNEDDYEITFTSSGNDIDCITLETWCNYT